MAMCLLMAASLMPIAEPRPCVLFVCSRGSLFACSARDHVSSVILVIVVVPFTNLSIGYSFDDLLANGANQGWSPLFLVSAVASCSCQPAPATLLGRLSACITVAMIVRLVV